MRRACWLVGHLESLFPLYIVFLVFIAAATQGCVPTQGGRTAQLIDGSGKVMQPDAYYAGYSKKYVPYREKLATGNVDDVLQMMDEEESRIRAKSVEDAALAEQLRLVGLMERASLSLQIGETEKALKYCCLGQEMIEERASESYFKEGMSSLWKAMTDVGGVGEFGRYDAPGYEKIMLLDIASMAYLLEGDERAFNIARLAIEWQDAEKEKFTAELEKKVEELGDEKKADNEREKANSYRLMSVLEHEFSKYEKTALTVPNAFVNPFGDYVIGMVNEFKSIKLKSLVSNAHIAYSEALELNPGSKVLQQAVKDTKERKSADHLVHVVALDGFVPEKKVLSIPIDRDIDVELPTFNPIPSKVAKINVMTAGGKLLATLSPVADVSALALRHQKDSLPYIQAMLLAAVLRDTAIVLAGDAMLGMGNLIGQIMDEHQEPDTTSWMTLPSTVMAARIYAPRGLKEIKIRTYNSHNKMLAEKKVNLSEGTQHFVLVRSIDETLYAYPSKKIWSPKTKAVNTES